MEWQRKHQRRVDRDHARMTKKVVKESHKQGKPAAKKDQRIDQLMKKHDRYEAKQQRNSHKRVNKDGGIVAYSRGDTGCAVVAVLSVASAVVVGVLAGWKGIA